HTVAGMAAAAAGLDGAAEEHLETALGQADDLPQRLEQPQVRHQLALLLAGRGGDADVRRARVLLADAISQYRRIGMPRHLTMARELVSRLEPTTELRGRARRRAAAEVRT
ncbi:MAG TPA: hypothetical protein VH134_14940, partial [Candidatus Dormibacteraeota bacterium]|nr:hypothetical protein [Candidatus Dormibacteraeota bacterium]